MIVARLCNEIICLQKTAQILVDLILTILTKHQLRLYIHLRASSYGKQDLFLCFSTHATHNQQRKITCRILSIENEFLS